MPQALEHTCNIARILSLGYGVPLSLACNLDATPMLCVCDTCLLFRRRSPTPPPSDEEEEKSEKGDEDSNKDSEEDVKTVYKMPPPDAPLAGRQTLRVPSPAPHVVQPIIINQVALWDN